MAGIVRVTGVLLVSLCCAAPVVAQRRTDTAQRAAGSASSVRLALDAWLVGRYRGAQLLDDSTIATRTSSATAPPPRVESTVRAATGDTLFAIHFGTQRGSTALRVGTVMRLTEPGGAPSSQSARVLARRHFRAPALPGPTRRTAARVDQTGRYGWGYMLVVVRPVRRTPLAIATRSWRGWLLLESPDTLGRRPDGTTGVGRRADARQRDSVRADTVASDPPPMHAK